MGETTKQTPRDLENRIHELRIELARLRAQQPRTRVQKNYLFSVAGGKKQSLLDLFGKSTELFVVHNMGVFCTYCTMWADGFNGLLPHIESRCSFVVISDDPPEVQKDLAERRGWRFKMVSSQNTSFKEDFGFLENGTLIPGASTFYTEGDGAIFHCNDTRFEPGDLFCPTWHLLDLLPLGEDGWRPRIAYS